MPWQSLSASWAHIANRGDVIELLNLVWLLGISLLALVALRRLPLAYSLYVWPCLALLYFRQNIPVSPLAGALRYTLVLFPCFIVLGLWLARRPWLAAGWLVVSGLLEALLLVYFVHWGVVA